MSRLCGKSIREIQENIAGTAAGYAGEAGCVCVQKDACTVVTDGSGDIYLNISGNSGMATAGSGDVLTGIILSLLARGYLPGQAAILGAYLHGLAGDIAASRSGMESVTASDIIDNIGNAYLKLKNRELL